LTFNNEWINHVKTIQPSIKLVISWCSTDISNLKLLEGPDLILTSTKPLETWFRKEGLKVELLRHAFDKRVIDKIDAKNKNNKISFIGTLQRNRKAYDYRCNIVESLIRNIPIDIYSPYVKGNNIKILIKKILYDYMITLKKLNFKDEQIKRIPLMNKVNLFQGKPTFNFHDTLSKNIIGNVYGINMFKIMSSSLISLNVEANVGLPNSNYTGNIRVFEATGVGSCLLTDWKEDINELYDPDYEIITYKSIPECIEKAKWLLDNPTKCIEIGKAGQKRTLKDHTYKERCIQLDCIIKKYYKTI
jgi:spore maturation protein CgeB